RARERPPCPYTTLFRSGKGGVPAAGNEAEAGLPLEPARWARFTTSKGTWISLDVSPDGQTIVFDLLGDLYTIPITGGTATRLTQDRKSTRLNSSHVKIS